MKLHNRDGIRWVTERLCCANLSLPALAINVGNTVLTQTLSPFASKKYETSTTTEQGLKMYIYLSLINLHF